VIPVRRPPAPPALANNGLRWLRELRAAVANPGATRAQVEGARNKYRHPAVKDALVRMFHGKCAYCESKVTVVTYGAIEHFLPKGDPLYTHLTFDWNNLLLSCDICNDAGHKGVSFPLDAGGNPLLIDPTVDVPGLHLLFDWDPAARSANVYGADARGREVVRIFDLNGVRGRKDLIEHRSRYVDMLLTIQKRADQGDARAKSLLREACLPSAEYNAFARALVCPPPAPHPPSVP